MRHKGEKTKTGKAKKAKKKPFSEEKGIFY